MSIVLGALACVLALALPASAAETENDLEDALAAFSVQGTNGYSMLVFAGPSLDQPAAPGAKLKGAALVAVHQGETSVTYIVPATVTADFVEGRTTVTSLQFSLGREGKVALTFKPSGGKAVAGRPGCRGVNAITYAQGTYEGTIEYHGAEGFTDVSASSAVEQPQELVKLLCAGEITDELTGPHLRGARLELQSHKGPDLELQVNQNRPGASVRVDATLSEQHGRTSVTHSTVLRLPGSTFSFDRRLRHARFSPGAPFAGRAVFDRGAKPAHRWRGNLTLDFPGDPKVRFTGPGLQVSLDHAVRRITGHGIEIDRLARALR